MPLSVSRRSGSVAIRYVVTRLFDDERQLQVHVELGDLPSVAVRLDGVDLDVLDVAQRLAGLLDAASDGVLDASSPVAVSSTILATDMVSSLVVVSRRIDLGRLRPGVDLYEYQGKELFREAGIPVSEGRLATTPEEAAAAAEELGGQVVVKAQVLIGGRGKAGGIKLADSPAEAEARARDILGLDIRGHVVRRLWIERASDIAKEYYLSVTFDRGEKKPLFMLTTEGGIDIEEVRRALAGATRAPPRRPAHRASSRSRRAGSRSWPGSPIRRAEAGRRDRLASLRGVRRDTRRCSARSTR